MNTPSSNSKPMPTQTTRTSSPTTHIYVLLDRSGSMEPIRSDVIGGFNAFVASQQADGDDARLTLVQFDSHEDDEIVLDDYPIGVVPTLTQATFVPRGGTPLLDATGKLIAKAKKRAKARSAAGEPESIVFVTITDGMENSSRRFTVEQIRQKIERRKAKGWTFVFLSAGPDAYAEAGQIGYDRDTIQAWAPCPAGVDAAFASVSESMIVRRQATRAGAPMDSHRFFEGAKPAERLRDHQS